MHRVAGSLPSVPLFIDHATGLPGRSYSGHPQMPCHSGSGLAYKRNTQDWLHLTDPIPGWDPDVTPWTLMPYLQNRSDGATPIDKMVSMEHLPRG